MPTPDIEGLSSLGARLPPREGQVDVKGFGASSDRAA
jgi:hypothetical protein